MIEPTAVGLPQAISGPPRSHLSAKVIGACLRSAFIEVLYEDCSDMLPPNAPASAAPTLKLAAE